MTSASAAARAQRQPVDDHATPVRSERVFRWWDYPAYVTITAVQLGALGYLAAIWFGGWTGNHPILFAIMTGLLLSVVGVQLLRWALLPKMQRPLPMPAREGWRVGVATTFVPAAESLEMLEHTLCALVQMDYPHDTWVLDEGDSDEVRELCARLGALHYSRKNKPQYQTESGEFASRTKHGNYNAWLDEIGYERYEIIVGFDPDHVAEPTFLNAALGYFDDPRIAYVQLPQVYYNQEASFIARGAAEETYAYYGSTQLAAYAGGWPLLTGCHHVHRVSALRQVGGFPAHNADDLLITFYYRADGWEGIYVPEIQARGLTPVDWSSYLRQQLRWARSVLDIKFRIQPWLDTKLPRTERLLSMIHGLSYLQCIPTFVAILILVYMLASGSIPFVGGRFFTSLLTLTALFKLCDFYRQRFFLDPWTEWGLHWRSAILQFAKWPFLLVALVDVMRNRKVGYTLTPKLRQHSSPHTLAWVHGAVVAVLVAAWLFGRAAGYDLHPSVEAWALGIVLLSLGLVVTDFFPFPAPYDADLWKRHARGSRPMGPRLHSGALGSGPRRKIA